jgi:hypothetical protein
MAALVLGFALVFSSLPAAWAAAPPSSAMEIRRIDFESGSVDQALPLIVAGAPQPMAYWGVISNTALSGTKSLWCAGTTYPGGVNPSAFWSTYATATAGDAWVRVPQTADYYDSWIRFAYSMPTKGSQDFFSSILLNGSDSPLYAHADLATTAPGAWAVDTWRLGANGRARTAAGLMLRFVDQYEVIGGSESAGRDDRGQGPAVDDIVVTGYKYGPVMNLTANRVSGHVELTWAKPQMTPTNTAQDTR